MTPEEYAAQQALITASTAAYVQRLASMFTGPALTMRGWLDFLRAIFPVVQRNYTQAAELGRKFYDSQRTKHHAYLPANERLLGELKFEWFVQNMEPARGDLSREDAPQQAVAKTVLTAVREVEMAGRRQIIGAVNNDPEQILQGWARVATGRETCAWCLMLISRGAELNHKGNFAYSAAETAGLILDETTALDLWSESGQSLEEFKKVTKPYIEKWHTGCDCMAVPVFDINNWPGRDQAKRAMQLWIDAGKEADKLMQSGESRTQNTNTETLNALRRRLERGDVSMYDYAFAA